MNAAQNRAAVAEGKALLDELSSLYFVALKSSQVEQQPSGQYRCSFELPSTGRQSTSAPTMMEAVRAAVHTLSDVLTATPRDRWPDAWRELAATTGNLKCKFQASPLPATSERFQSKARQFTIGVTLPERLKSHIQSEAEKSMASFSEAARIATTIGFEDFDERSFSEGSDLLLTQLFSELSTWKSDVSEQVMLRLEPQFAVRIRTTAKSYRRSVSEVSAMCIAHGIALQTQWSSVEQWVHTHRGNKLRELAPQIGLGTQIALLSSVLAGTVRAPRKLLTRLSLLIETSEDILSGYFKQALASRTVPAFKSETEKPQIAGTAKSWKDAVLSLHLPKDEVQKLLLLDD
jgi:hypothetical protein